MVTQADAHDDVEQDCTTIRVSRFVKAGKKRYLRHAWRKSETARWVGMSPKRVARSCHRDSGDDGRSSSSV